MQREHSVEWKCFLGSCHVWEKEAPSVVPEIQDSARRWSGFVCPDCRFVFRVARDHDGKGLVCPSCSRLLKIPSAGDALPPLLADQFDQNDERLLKLTGASSNKGEKNVRRKRKRRKRRSEDPDWESDGRSRSGRRSQARRPIVLLTVALAMLLGALGLIVSTSRDLPNSVHADSQDAIVPDAMPESFDTEDVPVPEVERELAELKDDSGFLNAAAPVVRGFLNASTVEDLLKFVDQPERVEKRAASVYSDGVVEPPGLRDYSQFSQVTRVGLNCLVPLRTRDFQIRTIVLRDTEDGIKVDWESWIGWSQVPPAEFISQRPTGPHVFRVSLSLTDYYNFTFSDEQKWQSLRLTFPEEENSIYAYVERNTEVFQKISSLLETGSAQMMLEIQFPECGEIHDQVEITAFVSNSWIDPEYLEEQ